MDKEKITHSVHRGFMSFIFIIAGYGHLFNTQNVVERLATLPTAEWLQLFAPLSFYVFASGMILFVAGLTLLLGLWVKQSAFLLIFVLVPITLTVQLQGQSTLGPLLKNIALLGGLIYFLKFGQQGWGLKSLINIVRDYDE